MNIFNISQELEDIFYQIEENGGEITPELEERLAITEDRLHDKLDSYRKVYSKFMSDVKTCKEEELRIARLRRTKENQVEKLKDTMLAAVQQFGALGKSGNRLINLPDAKLYTKASACTEVDLNRSSVLMQLFLEIFHTAWEQDTLDPQVCRMTEGELLRKINLKLEELYPNEEVIPFTIDDLYGLKINFGFSYSLAQLNNPASFSLLQAWFDNHEDSQNSISADVNKTDIKNRIKDGKDITIADIVEHDSLIIK
jgi:hypothetical protein